MQYFLAKTDPETYSIEQLAKDKRTVWDGVKNAQAVQVLKSMKVGDKVFIYHSQGEGTIRGIVKVSKIIGTDPKNNKSWLVEFTLLKEFKEPYISIKQVKASGEFSNFALVRQSRLSTMTVPKEFVDWFIVQTKQSL